MEFDQTEIVQIQSSDGLELNIHVWQPDNPKIILVATHGGLSHGGDYMLLANFFKQYNIATISYDLRGHLRKKVKGYPFSDYSKDLVSVAKYANDRYDDLPIFLIGHSVGSIVTLRTWIECEKDLPTIDGLIISAPYFENALKASWIAVKLVGPLAKIMPNAKAPAEDLVPYLTHDEAIMKRIKQDILNQTRTEIPTIGFANYLIKSFSWAKKNIHRLSKRTLVLIPGMDKIADTAVTEQHLALVDQDLLDIHRYPENFHENFNELNREEIFKTILDWVKAENIE